jgi:hypothetical protein
MNPPQAVPTTTIPVIRQADSTRELLMEHREEAQRIYNSFRRGGLSRREALAKARGPIKAARFAQELRRAELANTSVAV